MGFETFSALADFWLQLRQALACAGAAVAYHTMNILHDGKVGGEKLPRGEVAAAPTPDTPAEVTFVSRIRSARGSLQDKEVRDRLTLACRERTLTPMTRATWAEPSGHDDLELCLEVRAPADPAQRKLAGIESLRLYTSLIDEVITTAQASDAQTTVLLPRAPGE